MIHQRHLIAACLILILSFTSACQSEPDSPPASAEQSDSTEIAETTGEEPAATAEPTTEPQPTNTVAPTEPPAPTATSAPAISLADPIRSETYGFSIRPAIDFEVEQEGSGLFISDGSGDNEAALILDVDSQVAGQPETVQGVIESFIENVLGPDTTVEEPESIEISGISGLKAAFSGPIEDEDISGQIIALEDGERLITIFGGTGVEKWEASFRETFEAMIASIEFFPPVTVESGEDAEPSTEATRDTAGQSTGAGERISDEANGFSILVPEGLSPNQSDTTVLMANPISMPGATILFSVVPVQSGVDSNIIADSIQSSVISEGYEASEPKAIVIEGVTGSQVDFNGEENGEPIAGSFAYFTTPDKVAFITGAAPQEMWQSDLMTMFETALLSIQLTSNVAEGSASSDNSTAPQAEQATNTESDPSDSAESTDSTSDEPAAVITGSGGDGFACISGDDVGLSCITPSGEWVSYDEDNSALSSNYITAMTACPSGQILSAGFDEINIFDGETFTQLPGTWEYSSPDGIACGPNNEIWVIYFEGASYYDGATWTDFEYSDFASDDGGLVNDVTIGQDGTAWIVTSNIIAAYNNGTWTEYKVGAGLPDKFFFSNIAVNTSGTPYVSHSSGFLTLDGQEWIEIESGSFDSFEHLAVNSAGEIFVATFSDGIKRYNGSTFTTLDTNTGLTTTSLRTMVQDGSERVWVGTEYGLNVITSDGIQTFLMENSELKDNRVEEIAISGSGPTLPSFSQKETGSMAGNIVLPDGSPLADATVEICVEPFYSSFYGETPCSDQPLFFQGTTNSAGEFQFTDIPTGRYVMVFFVEDGWAQLSNEFGFGSGRIPVDPGEEAYVGEIVLEEEE